MLWRLGMRSAPSGEALYRGATESVTVEWTFSYADD